MDNYSVLKIYASTTDTIGMKLLYEQIVYLAKEKNISGVTVYRGIMGYGLSSKKVNTSKFWELTEKLPIVIEMIDKTEVLNQFFKQVEKVLDKTKKGCVVYMLPVEMKLLKEGSK